MNRTISILKTLNVDSVKRSGNKIFVCCSKSVVKDVLSIDGYCNGEYFFEVCSYEICCVIDGDEKYSIDIVCERC